MGHIQEQNKSKKALIGGLFLKKNRVLIREQLGIIVRMLDSKSVPRFKCFTCTESVFANDLWAV